MTDLSITPKRKLLWMSLGRIFFFVVLITLLWLGWMNYWMVQCEVSTQKLGYQLGQFIAESQTIEDSVFQDFLKKKSNVGYLVVVNYQSGEKPKGVFDQTNLKKGSWDLLDHLKIFAEEKTLKHLLRPGEGFPGKYLHVVSAAFVPPQNSHDQTPLGLLKIGYVVPGYIYPFSFGKGFSNLLWLLWGLAGGLGLGLVIYQRIQSRFLIKQSLADPLSELFVPREITEPESEANQNHLIYVDGEGHEWKVLQAHRSLRGWSVKGQWSSFEGELMGYPWGSSIVREDLTLNQPFVFQVRAKKLAGPDGFILLFPVGPFLLAWVVGGWRNSRSEVAGYSQTAVTHSIQKGVWYIVEVRVGAETLEGHINGNRFWSLSRSEVTGSSPDVGFQKGLGLGVWNTLSKFSDLRFREL